VTLPIPLEQNASAQALAPTLLLERGAEVAALEALLDATRSGDGRLVVIEGSAGIGKTRLLAEARALAVAAEFAVLTARGGELEGQFAFGIVRQLFEAPLAALNAEQRAGLLAGAAELSASLFASAPDSGDDAESSFAKLHGLYWLAANFALRNPTLLVVDDLHWADEPSLRWLVYLAHRIEGLPLLLLVGTRPAEQADAPALVADLLGDSAAVAIRPAGLGPASVATLASRRLKAEPDSDFTAALHSASAGNPLFLVALLDALSREGIAPKGHATDGAVQGHVVGTWLHGPVLPRNPELADLLLEWAAGKHLEPLGERESRFAVQVRSERIAEARRYVRENAVA
jgi:predicted ATPase